jgi:two-component system phosphate regulon sensor histidine kinase PhoR
MKWNKEYTSITLGYLFVLLYIALVNDRVINILLVIGLFIFQIVVYQQIKERISLDKKTTLMRMQNKLEKTQKQQQIINDRFLSLSQSVGSGLLMVDEYGVIQYANKDMTDAFERDFSEVEYKELSDMPELYQFIHQAYLIEDTLRKQISYKGKHYDLISTPLFEDGIFQGCLILSHDITIIQNAESYQKRFTADVSHELRTPLSAIKGFSEILARDDDMPAKDRQEFIRLIHKESERMEVILRDLLEISKLDRIDFELQLTTNDISVTCSDAVSILERQVQDSGLDIYVQVEPCNMRYDKDKILQVILNLIKNAISYTDKGTISITGEIHDDEYIIKVSDTGIGINEEDYDKIFKRFYRVDKARSRDTGGSGLGLSISKNTIHKHDGNIRVSSIVNKGTTFTISLPIKK